MKEQILQLRQDGKTYNEIVKITGCSKSLVCYYCCPGAQEKTADRQRRNRKANVLLQKVDNFKNSPPPSADKQLPTSTKRTGGHYLTDRVRKYQSRVKGHYGKRDNTFSHKDVLAKFGKNAICYLTGKPIDLTKPKTYSFDHVVPKAKGGDNSLENLGLACREANQAKHDLLAEELFDLCERILRHNGYLVIKPEDF